MKSWKDLTSGARAGFEARARQADEVLSRYRVTHDKRNGAGQREITAPFGDMNNPRDMRDFTILAHPPWSPSAAPRDTSLLALSRATDGAASTQPRDFVVRNLPEGRFYGFVLYRKPEFSQSAAGPGEMSHTADESDD